MNNQHTLQNWLDGGAVQRFHQWEMLDRQSVAAHTFNMLLIAEYTYKHELGDKLMRELTQAILFHDLAEGRRGVSDVSAWAKWEFPNLDQAVKAAEKVVEHRMGFPTYELTPTQHHRLKFCDYVELMYTVLRERKLGNTILFNASWPVITDKMNKEVDAMSLPEVAIFNWVRGEGFKYE